MWVIGLVCASLGITDAIQSVLLQRTGQFYEDGLPSTPRRSLVWGAHPTAVQLVGGALAISAALLFVGELVLGRWLPTIAWLSWTPWLRDFVYGVWFIVEAAMVWNNWKLFAMLRKL